MAPNLGLATWSCGIWGRLLALSEPQFAHLDREGNIPHSGLVRTQGNGGHEVCGPCRLLKVRVLISIVDTQGHWPASLQSSPVTLKVIHGPVLHPHGTDGEMRLERSLGPLRSRGPLKAVWLVSGGGKMNTRATRCHTEFLLCVRCSFWPGVCTERDRQDPSPRGRCIYCYSTTVPTSA